MGQEKVCLQQFRPLAGRFIEDGVSGDSGRDDEAAFWSNYGICQASARRSADSGKKFRLISFRKVMNNQITAGRIGSGFFTEMVDEFECNRIWILRQGICVNMLKLKRKTSINLCVFLIGRV